MEGHGHAGGAADGGAESGEVGGGVGQGPGEEEQHGGGFLLFGGAEGSEGAFEVVLGGRLNWDVKKSARGKAKKGSYHTDCRDSIFAFDSGVENSIGFVILEFPHDHLRANGRRRAIFKLELQSMPLIPSGILDSSHG